MPADLSGIHVLITRPAHQSAHLQQLVEQAGGKSLLFPLLEIKPTPDAETIKPLVERLHGFDLAIFVSPNAIEHGLQIIHKFGELPQQLKLATIGKGSAKTLESLTGRKPDFCPKQQFDSEGFLALEAMQHVSGMNIIIFRGQQGRELLAKTLEARGANITYAPVYRRVKPEIKHDLLQQALADNTLHIIIITSGEAMRNLIEIAGEQYQEALHNVQLVVINSRLADLTKESGFNKPALISDTASDEAIINAIQHWKNSNTAETREPV